MNISEQCKQAGVKYAGVMYAMHAKGYSLSEAIEYAKTNHRLLLKYNGMWLVDYCRKEEISYKAVLNRLYREGMTIDKAIKLIRRSMDMIAKGYTGHHYKYFVEGVPVVQLLTRNEYQSFLRLVIDKGLDVETAYKKIKKK